MRRLSHIQKAYLAAIVAINAFLLVTIFAQFSRRPEAVGRRPDIPLPAANLVARQESISSLDAYSIILARPLFSKDRAPFVAPQVTRKNGLVPQPVVDPGFKIGGIIIRDGSRKAFIYTRTHGSGSWAAVGEKVMGWELQSVSDNEVMLKQQSTVLRISLYAE